MPAPDWFGFDDPAVPRNLTAPAGMEAVHQDGFSWARQGTRREDTSWITPAQWNRLIAQMRGLLSDVGIDLSDLSANSPLLLREFVRRYAEAKIVAFLAGTDINGHGVMLREHFDADEDDIIDLGAGGTGVAASDFADLRDKIGVTDAIDEAVSGGLAAIRDGVATDWDTLAEIATGLGGKANTSHTHAIADVTGLQGALNDLAANAALPIGAELPWPGATPPAGWLEEDGAALLVASYPDLAAALYCGDANNATADWGYKATTNVNPNANRSTAGTYIVLPDQRGVFIRGWDHGRGVDSGRSLWSMQLDQMQQITGAINGAVNRSVFAGSSSGAFTGSGATVTAYNASGASQDGFQNVTFNSANSPGARVGAETRGRNGARMIIIKY